MIEFVKYTGRYPNLCAGNLTLRIDGEEVNLSCCLTSGGVCAIISEDGSEYVATGKWQVNVPQRFARYEAQITDVVNACVPWGCCGGCI